MDGETRNMPQRSEETILVLQGGGALGAYQAGVHEALAGRGIQPDWIAGISIGAINAALIAGNRPEQRDARLRTFWERVTHGTGWAATLMWPLGRRALNETYAAQAVLSGVPGFFRPRVPAAPFRPAGQTDAMGYYDTSPLRETLLELVDFDYLNAEGPRLSVGAVNVQTGSMTWFDSDRREIAPEHIMASGALPPGFPPVEIDGALYWDGGLLSNTPLQYVLFEAATGADKCVWQVDLFKSEGRLPNSVWDVDDRMKDIRYASRTRLNTDLMRELYAEAADARAAFEKLPRELRDDPRIQALASRRFEARLSICHLIYRQSRHEHQSKDYEFSRQTMRDHWAAGHADVADTLDHPEWLSRHKETGRVQVFDLSRAGQARKARRKPAPAQAASRQRSSAK